MFNEAFWFFYIVGLVDDIHFVCSAVVVFGGLGLLASGVVGFLEDDERVRGLSRKIFLVVAIAATVGVLTPSNNAFYAGAAQYVGEAGEVDQTLLRLKKLVDKKLEELEADDT